MFYYSVFFAQSDQMYRYYFALLLFVNNKIIKTAVDIKENIYNRPASIIEYLLF